MADQPLDLNALLTELGFDSTESQQLARTALVDAKLTTPTKSRIDGAKRPRVEGTLRSQFLVSCGAADCERDAGERTVVRTSALQHCWSCHGSPNRRGAQSAIEAMRRGNIRRLVIVGGSPSVHDELRQFLGNAIDLRIVSGTERRTLDLARSDMRWADLVLVWGSSELDHKVSTLYVNQKDHSSASVVLINRRGIAALMDAIVQHVAKTRG